MSHQQAEVVIRPGSLSRELAAGTVGEEVGLSDAHLLLLLRSGVDGMGSSLGGGRCRGGKAD